MENYHTNIAWLKTQLKEYPYPTWIKRKLDQITMAGFCRVMVNDEITVILYKDADNRSTQIVKHKGTLVLGWPHEVSFQTVDYMAAVREIIGRR